MADHLDGLEAGVKHVEVLKLRIGQANCLHRPSHVAPKACVRRVIRENVHDEKTATFALRHHRSRAFCIELVLPELNRCHFGNSSSAFPSNRIVTMTAWLTDRLLQLTTRILRRVL